MKLIILSICAFCLLICKAQSQRPAKILESFEDGVPQGMSASNNSISIDEYRMKHGNKSLKWVWKGNDQLVFNSPVGYHPQKLLSNELLEIANGHGGSATHPILEPPRGFFLWVYNQEASKQRLRIQFGEGDKTACEFDFNLNFKGWRNIAIAYDRGDMRGVPLESMNRMTIHAPATGSGTFYFDMLGMSVTMNPRTVGPNPQLPEIDQHPRLVAQYPHLLYAFSAYKPSLPLHELSSKEVADMKVIEQHFMDLYWPEYLSSDFPDSKFDKIKKTYDSFEIVRVGEEISGRPLIYQHIMNDHFPELHLSKDKKFEGLKRWRQDFNYLLRDISNLHHYTQNADIKAKLETMFIDVFDYGVDQGFDSGAGLGWLHHYSYNIREYGPAMYIMRDVLKRYSRLTKAKDICSWFYATNQVYNEKLVYNCEDRVAGNADEIQGLLMPKLMTFFLQPDSPEKVRDLRHFSNYFSKVFTGYAQALDECFKPDGTVFHHAGHSFGYGGRAIHGAVSTMYALSGTSFKATEDSYQRIKKVTKTYIQQMFTDEFMVPKAFANIRFSDYNLVRSHYNTPALLALSRDERDEELIDLFQTIIETVDEDGDAINFWKQKVDSLGASTGKYNYTGCIMYPYSSVATNRKANDWMVTLRAHSKYIYPFESWGSSFFAFPLYIANGYLDVSYPNSIDSASPKKGTWYSGYNWHRWPGTTTVAVPYDNMVTDPGQVRDEGGEYLFSDQSFVGGVSTTYGCGVYAFQFKGHDKFNLQGFSGKKTYVFAGNKVVCMGSDITSNSDYNVETTLFQNFLESENSPTYSSGQGAVTSFPFEEKRSTSKPFWLLDQRSTGYYICHDDNNQVLWKRMEQTNPDKNNKKDVSGDFETAYIDHGMAPTNASYRYILVTDTEKKEMEGFAQKMKKRIKPVEIRQQDKVAHVVQLTDEKAMAYAVYKKQGATFDYGIVESVSKQSTFVIKEEGKQLRLSVSDPDLNIYDGLDDLLADGSRIELSIYEKEWFYWPSRPTKVQLTLKGEWRISEQVLEMETAPTKQAKILSSDSKFTVVEFECRDGLSAELLMEKR